MTVSVVFAVAGVIALLFGIIGGGIKAKEVEIPLLPIKVRIVTVIVGLALLGVTVWLENNKVIADKPVSTPQIQALPSTDVPLISSTDSNNSSPNIAKSSTPAPNARGADLEKLYRILYQAKNWGLILQESFENNDNNWTLWNVDDDYKAETIQIDRGVFLWKLRLKKPNLYYTEIAPSTSLSDFYYSAKAKRVSGATEEQRNQASWGIIFRRQGENFYALRLNDLQEYSLWLHNSTGWTELVGNTKSSLVNKDTFNELSVIIDGGEITYFINGTPINTFSDSTLSEGNIGFYASLNYIDDEVPFEFDDLEVRQKPEN